MNGPPPNGTPQAIQLLLLGDSGYGIEGGGLAFSVVDGRLVVSMVLAGGKVSIIAGAYRRQQVTLAQLRSFPVEDVAALFRDQERPAAETQEEQSGPPPD